MSRGRLLDGYNPSIAPEFLASPELLDSIGPSGERGSMMLGLGPNKESFTISVLRPAPTRIVCVGGLYFARQLVLRAIATGAWVMIATARPDVWKVLAKAAGTWPSGRAAPVVQIRRLNPVELPRSTEDGPLLVIHDGGSTPQELFPPRSAWQTTVYVLPYLHPQVAAIANAADLVLMQRQPVGQAQLAARIWHLPPQPVQQLTTLQDDQLIAFGRGLWQPVQLTTSTSEVQLLGPIRRGD